MAGDTRAKKTDFSRRVSLFYAALFVIYGMHVPYMPVWLDWRGLSAGQISAVMAAPFFLRLFVTPLVALLADRASSHRRWIYALSWIGLALAVLLSQAQSFWPILVLAVPLIICTATVMPLTETLAAEGVRTFGVDYGRIRLWGSLTFIGASFLGGKVIETAGRGQGVHLIIIGCALTVVAAWFLPPGEAVKSNATGRGSVWRGEEPRALLKNPAFALFLLASGLVQASHATFMTFGTLIWQKQGLSGGWLGALWAIGVLTEVLLFAYSKTLFKFVGPVQLIAAGAAVAIIRWVVSAFDPPLAVLVPLTALHGVSYGATHIGAFHFMKCAVPRHASGSAQALYATVSAGVAMGAVTLLSGYVYVLYGSSAYLAMAAVAAVALGAALRLARVWDGRLVLDEWPDEPAIIPREPVLEAP